MITALVAVASVIVAVWAGAIVLAVWRDHQAAAESSDSTEEQVTANIERVSPQVVQPNPVHIAPSPLLPGGRHRRETIGDRARARWNVDSGGWEMRLAHARAAVVGPVLPAPRPEKLAELWAAVA